MPDLTFTQVAAQLPANSITLSGSDVVISTRLIMGETTVALADQKIGEFISKLLDACSKAQDAHNASNNPKFRSYNAPSSGTPTRNPTTGEFSSTFTYTVSVNIPLNRNTVDAVETQITGF